MLVIEQAEEAKEPASSRRAAMPTPRGRKEARGPARATREAKEAREAKEERAATEDEQVRVRVKVEQFSKTLNSV